MVDEHFEAGSPFSKITGLGRAHGVFTALNFYPGHENHFGLTYEVYKDREPRATIEAAGWITPSLRGDIFYAQENFVPNAGGGTVPKYSIARGILTYKINHKVGLILDYYQAYDASLNKQDSITFKTRFKLL
jgi:hypothetical protein